MPRDRIPDKVKRLVWVRCGGRCFICNKDLLAGDSAFDPITSLGDTAHIVGATEAPRSPRGQDDPAVEDRNAADNLVLACPTHHREIDSQPGTVLYTVDSLRLLKAEHERKIAFATSIATSERSLPVLIVGDIEGGSIQIARADYARAIIETEGCLPGWPERYDAGGWVIDLSGIPTGGPEYYSVAAQAISRRIDELKRVDPRHPVERISLFAAAKLPLLVHAGHALDDTIPTTIYQRHRVRETWGWPEAPGPVPEFDLIEPADHASSEVLVTVEVTATPDVELLPPELRALPRWRVTTHPLGDTVIDSLAALHEFERTVRRLYTRLDDSPVTKIHLVAAAPVSAAVVLGRGLPRSHHSPVAVYERAPKGYAVALELSA